MLTFELAQHYLELLYLTVREQALSPSRYVETNYYFHVITVALIQFLWYLLDCQLYVFLSCPGTTDEI